MTYTGQALKRFEDPRLVTGMGVFVDDVKLPGMLYAGFLRSPHAHARIRAIDASEARSMPGVVAVLIGEDIAGVLTEIPPRVLEEWEMDELQAGARDENLQARRDGRAIVGGVVRPQRRTTSAVCHCSVSSVFRDGFRRPHC